MYNTNNGILIFQTYLILINNFLWEGEKLI